MNAANQVKECPKAVSREVSAFLELSKALSGQKDIFTLLKLIKNEAVKLINADRASIFLVDKGTSELWTLMADGVDIIRFPMGKGIVGHVIDSNDILNIPDAACDPRFNSEIDKQTGYKTRNIICIPMRNRYGLSVGAIEVLNKLDGVFTEYDQNLLMILGTQAAIAVENVEMLDDLQENLQQVNLLNRIQRQANQLMDLNLIFEMILKEVVGNLRAGGGVITWITRIGGKECSCFIPPEEFGTFYVGDKLFDTWNLKNPLLKDCFAVSDEIFKKLENKDIFTTSSGIVVAIKDHEKAVGYLEVRQVDQEDRLFNRRAMDFLKVIAGQIMSFIEKVSLEEEKSRSEKIAVVGNMVSTIVHDIKNPLIGISGYAQMIRRKSKDEKIQGYATIMLEELTRLEQMNNELLTFVRGEQIKLDMDDYRIDNFIEDILQIVRADFESQNVAIETVLDYKDSVAMDVNRMKRVVVNIANNARDAMPDGGKFIILSRLSADGECIELEFKDTGTGMPPEIKARLFEPFVTYGKGKGTGLGMSITKNIVDKHKGKIVVESEQGKGTSFIVFLPVKKKGNEGYIAGCR